MSFVAPRTLPLVAVTAWVPPGGDLAERRNSSPYLRKIWRDAAWKQLWAAFDAGLGGVPVPIPLIEERGFSFDLDVLRSKLHWGER